MGGAVFSGAGKVSMGPGLCSFRGVAVFGSFDGAFVSIHAYLRVLGFAYPLVSAVFTLDGIDNVFGCTGEVLVDFEGELGFSGSDGGCGGGHVRARGAFYIGAGVASNGHLCRRVEGRAGKEFAEVRWRLEGDFGYCRESGGSKGVRG